jgi:hypothetical protein
LNLFFLNPEKEIDLDELRNIFVEMGKQTCVLLSDIVMQEMEQAFHQQFSDINVEEMFGKLVP